MTRLFLIPAATAALVSIACVFALNFAGHDSEHTPNNSMNESLASSIHSNLESIADLRSEVRVIQSQMSTSYPPPDTGISGQERLHPNDLEARIEMLEEAIEKISLTGSTSPKEQNGTIRKFIASSTDNPVEAAKSYQTEFENDSGIALGDYSDSIGEVFHAFEGIEVRGMECGNTICKVTYSENKDPETQQESSDGLELVDKLAQNAGGREVDVQYTKDSLGNNVMYIQLR